MASALQRLDEVKAQRESINNEERQLGDAKAAIAPSMERIKALLRERSGAMPELQEQRRNLRQEQGSMRDDLRVNLADPNSDKYIQNPLQRQAAVSQQLAGGRSRIDAINDLLDREGAGRADVAGRAQGLLESDIEKQAIALATKRQAMDDLYREVTLQSQLEQQAEQNRIAQARLAMAQAASGTSEDDTMQEARNYITGLLEQGMSPEEITPLANTLFGGKISGDQIGAILAGYEGTAPFSPEDRLLDLRNNSAIDLGKYLEQTDPTQRISENSIDNSLSLYNIPAEIRGRVGAVADLLNPFSPNYKVSFNPNKKK